MARHRKSQVRKLKEFRPSKLLWFWSSAGVALSTIAVGFTWGGWITINAAQHMADEAAQKARARLVAQVCVQRYIQGENFASRFAELEDAVTFKRQDLIEEGRWTDLPGIEEPVPGAARLCANELAGMSIPNNPAAKAMDNGIDNSG